MSTTFLLSLFMAASSVLAMVPLLLGLGLLVFSKRKQYGAAILAASLAGGVVGIAFLALSSCIFDLLSQLHFEVWVLFFASGFSFAGIAFAVMGFLAPLFRVKARWAGRREAKSHDGNSP